jgi:hypothetical protein
MSETLISYRAPAAKPPPASEHRIPHIFPVQRAAKKSRKPITTEVSLLPSIKPGQLWVVEHSSTDLHISPLGHRVVTAANVVVYDRALYPMVAANLPLGGYAEPASPPDGAPDKAFDRCIRFARDGWNVVRLVDHRPPHDARRKRIGRLIDRLIGAGCPPSQPVNLFFNAQQIEMELDTLGIAIEATTSEDCLAIAFAAVGAGAAPHLHAISSNGLAG